MAGLVRFVGVPRAVLNAEIAEMHGWKELGQRILAEAESECPVDTGTLQASLVVSYISGADPRILVGSNTDGDVLGYVTNGTSAHQIEPVNASVLAFTVGGVQVFTTRVSHPGTNPNPFILNAARAVVSQA